MGRPRVELDWNLHWCARHLEPFRAYWPTGAGVAMVALFDEAVQMDAVADAAKGDAGNLPAALARFAPLCCFLTAPALQRVYDKAGVTP